MNPEAAADTAVLVSALLTLLAIISKLVTANLVTRSKRVFAKLDVRRREIVSRLKEVQLKTTSAKGTLEFWERRRTETSQRVQDASRDLENYVDQFGADDDGWETEGEEAAEAESDMESEPAPEAIGEERGDSSVGETDAEDGPTGDPAMLAEESVAAAGDTMAEAEGEVESGVGEQEAPDSPTP